MRVKQSIFVASLVALALCESNQLLLADPSLSSGPIVEIVTESSHDPGANEVARLEINRSAHRVTLFQGENRIKTYPVAVGRAGWETPLGDFYVYQMVRDPTWKHPFDRE